MPDIVIKIDPQQQKDLEETLKGVVGGVGKAQAAAINRTMTHVRAMAAREIRKHINLPVARIKEAISIKDKATASKPRGTVRFSHRPVPLIDYVNAGGGRGSNQSPKKASGNGVSVTERFDKGRQTYRHYFFATMPNGHTGVFRRLENARPRKVKGKWTALPIREVFGASVEGTFAKAPGLLSEVLSDSGDFLRKQLASQVDRLLKRKKVSEAEGTDD